MSGFENSRFGKRAAGPVLDVPVAARRLALAEDTAANRKGVRVEEVRRGFARFLRVPVKTLENIRSERRKSVPAFLMDGIRDVMIEVLEAEIAHLEHEITIARQVGMDHREDTFEEAAASIAAARALLEKAAGAGRC